MNRLSRRSRFLIALSVGMLLGLLARSVFAQTSPLDENDNNVTYSSGWFRGSIVVPYTSADYTVMVVQGNFPNGNVEIYTDGTFRCEASPPPGGEHACTYAYADTEGTAHTALFQAINGAQNFMSFYRIAGKHTTVRGEPDYFHGANHWSHAPKVMPVDGRDALTLYNQLYNSAIGGVLTLVIGVSVTMMALAWLLNVFKQIAGAGSSSGGGKGGKSSTGGGRSKGEGVE